MKKYTLKQNTTIIKKIDGTELNSFIIGKEYSQDFLLLFLVQEDIDKYFKEVVLKKDFNYYFESVKNFNYIGSDININTFKDIFKIKDDKYYKEYQLFILNCVIKQIQKELEGDNVIKYGLFDEGRFYIKYLKPYDRFIPMKRKDITYTPFNTPFKKEESVYEVLDICKDYLYLLKN